MTIHRPSFSLSDHLHSRLPNVGTTIFTVMSALARQHGAVNLGQGFPDFDPDPLLLAEVTRAMAEGHNQYPPMAGLPELREAVAESIEQRHGRRYDPGEEITITAGATQAILTALLAVVHPGDEVILLDPAYDSYEPGVRLAGGVPVRLPPGADGRPDLDAVAAHLSPRTRALILNTPHNPTGQVWTAAEMRRLAALLAPTGVIVIADEVYETMVFDGAPHQSVADWPTLAERALRISSFGKSFHVTGWKVGAVAAPAALMAEFRKVHQFNVFTVNTPMQRALSQFMTVQPQALREVAGFYQQRRDLFRTGLHPLLAQGLRLLPCEGTYFQCVDYGRLPIPQARLDEDAFCRWLTSEIGVAAIPLSAFEARPDPLRRVIRLCFAKKVETLEAALERLHKLAS